MMPDVARIAANIIVVCIYICTIPLIIWTAKEFYHELKRTLVEYKNEKENHL